MYVTREGDTYACGHSTSTTIKCSYYPFCVTARAPAPASPRRLDAVCPQCQSMLRSRPLDTLIALDAFCLLLLVLFGTRLPVKVTIVISIVYLILLVALIGGLRERWRTQILSEEAKRRSEQEEFAREKRRLCRGAREGRSASGSSSALARTKPVARRDTYSRRDKGSRGEDPAGNTKLTTLRADSFWGESKISRAHLVGRQLCAEILWRSLRHRFVGC